MSGMGASPQDHYGTLGMAQHNARDDGWHDTNNTAMTQNAKCSATSISPVKLQNATTTWCRYCFHRTPTDTSMQQHAGINASAMYAFPS